MCRRSYLPWIVSLLVALGCDAAPSLSSRRIKPPPATVLKKADVWRTDFAAAKAEAQRDAKPLLVLFSAEWCSYCDRMQAELAKLPSFVEASQRFVCVEVDGEHAPEFTAEYRVQAYPTLILASPHGATLQRLVGVQSAEAVVAQMNATVTVVAGRRPMGEVR